MVNFVVNAFSGMVPMVSPRLIDGRFAQEAVNVHLTSGELTPLRAPLKVGNNLLSKAGVKLSIYRFGQDRDEDEYWFHWTTNVHVVRGNIADDTSEKTYFTGDGVPKYTYSPVALTGGGNQYPYGAFTLGVPKPDLISTNVAVSDRNIVSITRLDTLATVTTQQPHKLQNGAKPTIMGASDPLYNGSKEVTIVSPTEFTYTLTAIPAANATGTLVFNFGDEIETRLYAVTYVDANGAEGAPALLTGFLNVLQGQIVTFTGLPTVPNGNFNLIKKRIYRTGQGSQQSTLRFVGEVGISAVTFVDDKLGTELAENIPSLGYEMPPENMFGIIHVGNGMYAALEGNQCLICEPYQPHAWPISNRYSFNVKPVALGAFGNSIVVLTEGIPSILTGTAPESMSQDEIKFGQPCLSRFSVVEIAGGVMWASDEGLAFIGNSGFDLATKQRLTAREWEYYNPASIRAYRWENRYVAFYDNGTEQKGFVFDAMTLDFYHLDFYATAGFTDPRNGNLYLAIGDDVFRFDGGTNLTQTWKSKIFSAPKLINMGYAKVVATAYPVVFKLYADGILKHTKTVLNRTPFALPLGYKATDYEIEVSGNTNVRGIAIAESLLELKAVIE